MDVGRPIFTVDDLAQLPDNGKRYEILEGDLAVSPSPNRKHQLIVQAIFLFFTRLKENGLGQGFVAPFDVVLDTYNVTEPDVLFVCSDRPPRYRDRRQHPRSARPGRGSIVAQHTRPGFGGLKRFSMHDFRYRSTGSLIPNKRRLPSINSLTKGIAAPARFDLRKPFTALSSLTFRSRLRRCFAPNMCRISTVDERYTLVAKGHMSDVHVGASATGQRPRSVDPGYGIWDDVRRRSL